MRKIQYILMVVPTVYCGSWAVGWRATTFATYIHAHLRTFFIQRHFQVKVLIRRTILIYEHIPAKLLTSPSASAVFLILIGMLALSLHHSTATQILVLTPFAVNVVLVFVSSA